MKRLLLLVIMFFSFAANAAEPLPIKLVGQPKQAELVSKMEAYLNTLQSFDTEFVQTAAGEKTTGRFYLKRPGKFRWEYLTGRQALIIGSNSLIVYYDKGLNEVTHIPAKDTIANFLARKQIKLSGDIKVLSATEDGDVLRLVITQSKNPADGKLVLFFAKNPMQLTAMHVVDQDRNLTEIEFASSKFNPKLADDIFIFKNPKFYKNVWEKK